MQTLTEQLVHWITTLRPDWDPAGLTSFLYLEGGYSNDNYRFRYAGDRYVLRAPRPGPGNARNGTGAFIDRERELAFYRAPHAIAIPELIAFDTDSGRMISRWVAGRLLADLAPDATEVIEYLRALHRELPPLDRDYDPLLEARSFLETAAVPRWIADFAAAARWHPESPTPCHNDLNPWNLIRDPNGRWVTLDWEWLGRNDPLFDLVALHQGLGVAAEALPDLATALLGEPVPAVRLQHCQRVYWLREYGWAAAERAAGNDRAEIRDQQALGERRLRELL